MLDKKEQKSVYKFTCNICNFKCSKKYNYNKHLLTTKHKMLENVGKKIPETATIFKCECGNEYKHNQSYYRHKKSCNDIKNQINDTNEDNLDYKAMFLQCMAQNNELISVISSQAEKSEEMMGVLKDVIPKIGNTTNNNNNTFNLQVFLNEDCKDALNFSEFIDTIKVSFEDLENQAEIGYINGISKLFIENLQELGTHKRPIHCTDKKRKTLYIKENNEWDKEGSQNTLKKGIREVSRKTQDCLFQEKEENQEEYNDIESDFSQKYISIRRSLLPEFPQDTTMNKVIDQISKNSGITE